MKFILWVFALVFIFAIVSNYIVIWHTPNGIDIAGEPSDWIGYYAGAFASAISSIVAFVILIFNYKQNEKNFKELKDLQINTAIHNRNQQRLLEVCEELYELFISLNPSRIDNAIWDCIHMEINEDFKRKITMELKSLLLKSTDTFEKTLLICDMNSDIIELNKLRDPLDAYSHEHYDVITKMIKKVVGAQTAEDVEELMLLIRTLRLSGNFIGFKNSIKTLIFESRNRIDSSIM